MAIVGAKRNKTKIGICGQAPSDYPEFTRFLIDLGIDSISLNEDSVIKSILLVAEEETKSQKSIVPDKTPATKQVSSKQ
jgi:pyruvate,water dikinase